MKRRLGPVVALLLLAGLVSWVYWVEFRGAGGRRAAEQSKDRVLAFDRDALRSIRLTCGDLDILLRRDGETWAIAEPLRAPADRQAVEAMVSSLEAARIERRIDAGSDLKPFGLDPPRATVTVETEAGAAQVLAIGDPNPIGGARYALLPGGGQAALVTSALGDLAGKDLLSLRDRALVSFDPWKVTRLRIERRDGIVVAEKPASGWRLTRPVQAPADGPAITDLLNALQRARAIAFVVEAPAPADLRRFGLDPPGARVAVLQEGSADEAEVVFGKESGAARFARAAGRGPVLTVPADVWTKMNTPAADLRRKELVGLGIYRIRSVSAARQGQEAVVLSRGEDGGWTVSGAATGQVAAETVDAFLRTASDLRAKGFEDHPAEAARQALARSPSLELGFEEEAEGETAAPRAQRLIFGAPDRGGTLRVLDPDWAPLALVERAAVDAVIERLEAIVQEAAAPPAAADGAEADAPPPAAPPEDE